MLEKFGSENSPLRGFVVLSVVRISQVYVQGTPAVARNRVGYKLPLRSVGDVKSRG